MHAYTLIAYCSLCEMEPAGACRYQSKPSQFEIPAMKRVRDEESTGAYNTDTWLAAALQPTATASEGQQMNPMDSAGPALREHFVHMRNTGSSPTAAARARPCLLPFPHFRTICQPPGVQRQIVEFAACLHTLPRLVHRMAAINADVWQILESLTRQCAMNIVETRRRHCAREIVRLSNDRSITDQEVRQRVLALIEQTVDAGIDLIGVPEDRLVAVIKALKSARIETLVVNADIDTPAHASWVLEKLGCSLAASSWRAGRHPLIALNVTAMSWGPLAGYADYWDRIDALASLLRRIAESGCCLHSLAIQVPLGDGTSIVLDLLRVVHHCKHLRQLYLELDTCIGGDVDENFDFGAVAIQNLALALSANISIDLLSVKYNDMVPAILFERVHRLFLRFEEIRIGHVDQDTDFCREIEQGLRKTRTLERFFYQVFNNVDDHVSAGRWNALVKGLEANTSLKTLVLKAESPVDESMVKRLLAMLGNHPALETLQFAGNAFPDASQYLIDEFHARGLQTLNGTGKRVTAHARIPYDPDDLISIGKEMGFTALPGRDTPQFLAAYQRLVEKEGTDLSNPQRLR